MGTWLEVWVELYKDVNMKGQPPESGWVENLLSLTNLKFGLLVWATLSSPQRTGRREANNVYSDSCACEGREHMYQDMCVWMSGQPEGVSALLPPCQAWQRVPLPTPGGHRTGPTIRFH